MAIFRVFLAALWIVLVVYTVMVSQAHGTGLFQQFFGDIAIMDWPGQFNLDFMMLLMLSGLWTAWRNGWSGTGIGLGIAASFLGSTFTLPYLLILSIQARGDMRQVLLGKRAAA